MKSSEMDDNMALLVGNVWAALMEIPEKTRHFAHTEVEIVMEGEEYTNELIIRRPSGSYRVAVTKDE